MRRGRSVRSSGLAPDAQAVIDDPDVEAVVIVTPTTTHRDLVQAVVDAGKPLLCEKPLATNFDVVREMCATVAASGLTAQVGFHSRFHPLDQRARPARHHERARRAHGLHAARRPVLADGRRRPGPQLVAFATRRTRAAARCSNTRSTAPTSSPGSSVPPEPSTRGTRNVFGYDVEDTAVCTIEHDVGRRRHADLDLQRCARARGAPARGVLRAGRGRGHDRLPGRRARRRLPGPAARSGTRSASTSPRCAIATSKPKASPAATSSCTSTPPRAPSCARSATVSPRHRRSPTRSSAHALVDAAYRSVTEKTAAAVEL